MSEFEALVAPIRDEFPWGDLLAAQHGGSQIIYETEQDARYDEFTTAVYEAARSVLEGWGVGVDNSAPRSLHVGAIIEEGLADDLWAWVEAHVPGVVDQVRAVHESDVPAAVQAVLRKHLWGGRWDVDTHGNDEANGWVGPARASLAKTIETRIRVVGNSDPARVEDDFEDFRDFVLWRHMLHYARAEADVPCEQRGCDCECHHSNVGAS